MRVLDIGIEGACQCCLFFFFFQAEDGIRDYKVTGVQTCALPISSFAAPTTSRTSKPYTGAAHLGMSTSIAPPHPTTCPAPAAASHPAPSAPGRSCDPGAATPTANSK